MDANGLRFWMLSSESDWTLVKSAPDSSAGVAYCSTRKRLHLRSTPDAPPNPENFAQVAGLLDAVPFALDPYGTYARWDAASGHVVAGGAGAGEIPIFTPPPLAPVTDLVLGSDGVLYMAVDGQIVFVDRHDRWPNFTLPQTAAGFKAWRLVAHPGGGVIALDRDNHQLLRVQGLPLPDLPPLPYANNVLRPCAENADPPRVSATLALPTGEYYVAMAENGHGGVAILSWHRNAADNDAVWLRTLTSLESIDSVSSLAGFRFPYALAWLDDQQIALIASQNKKAASYAIGGMELPLTPTGDTYALAAVNPGPFVHGFMQPPHYNVGGDLFPLVPLSLNSLARTGTARNQMRLDSGTSRTAWHRLYLEASLPQRCGAVAWLAATDDPAALDDPATPWFPHVFGDAGVPFDFPTAPRGVWLREPCEVPFHPGLLGLAPQPQPQRKGLFMALAQRADVAVRTLRGRYLGVRLDLTGDGRATPEVAALRIYASRFSYVDHYLPELYREDTFGPDADVPGTSTRADFFERFVNIFEGPMTQMEDRVAWSYLLTNPGTTPEAGIDWLGAWIGVDPDPLPPDRRRRRILETPRLYRERGTVQGVADAIDVATAGLCRRGAVVLLEDYRLRHTFATILGADLSIHDDPLLPGYFESANSFVGDTLFLGDEHRQEFLSLFADAIETAREQEQVDVFFEALANRLTVFVHDQVETVDLQLVRRVVEREKPAHVAVTYLRASQPFLIGMASLLGANTYLAPTPPKDIARADESAIGRRAFIAHLPALDPRLEGRGIADFSGPIARLAGPRAVPVNAVVNLDAGGSSASPGHRLAKFHWTIVSGPS
ncbi:MAG: phage tail protein [Acidobacteriota bacterium]